MKISDIEKKETVEESAKAAAKILIFTMDLLDIENFIEGTIINDSDGRCFKLKFECVKKLNEGKKRPTQEGE